MIAIGGVIGAGLFVGSGVAIRAIGPAALLTYALRGALIVLVMRMLGEMAAARLAARRPRGKPPAAGWILGWLAVSGTFWQSSWGSRRLKGSNLLDRCAAGWRRCV